MKPESIALSKLPPNEQNRFTDRVSFLYLEHSKIVQRKTGVVGLRNAEGKIVF